MGEDPRWRWAPIGTPGNHKRNVLTLPVALEYAKAHGVCVVLYRHPIQGAVAITDVEREIMYANEVNAGMWGVFVPGAPAHLAQNISTARRAANSSPVVMHSITFPPEISLEEANEYRNRIGNAAAGEVVRLPFLPHSINVIVEGMNPAQWRADQRLAAQSDSVVIPVKCAGNSRWVTVAPVNPGAEPSKVKVHIIPVEPAFVVTFHKLRTYWMGV
jgi:hypothetical protein